VCYFTNHLQHYNKNNNWEQSTKNKCYNYNQYFFSTFQVSLYHWIYTRFEINKTQLSIGRRKTKNFARQRNHHQVSIINLLSLFKRLGRLDTLGHGFGGSGHTIGHVKVGQLETPRFQLLPGVDNRVHFLIYRLSTMSITIYQKYNNGSLILIKKCEKTLTEISWSASFKKLADSMAPKRVKWGATSSIRCLSSKILS